VIVRCRWPRPEFRSFRKHLNPDIS
jgi:hypothetical protein